KSLKKTQHKCSLNMKPIRKKCKNRKKKTKRSFPSSAEKENQHTKAEFRFPTIYRFRKSKFIPRLILPIWYVSARKSRTSLNTSRPNSTSKDTFATNMLPKTKKEYLSEHFLNV